MKRLPKEECEKENERLRKENERLRAENLLLKKVKALVEERESRNRRIGRGPLTKGQGTGTWTIHIQLINGTYSKKAFKKFCTGRMEHQDTKLVLRNFTKI